MKQNKKAGFTLVEIIIVIIILGVLAALALPKLFSTVEFSKSTEALQALGSIRQSIERCYFASMVTADSLGTIATYDNCNAFDEIDADDPGTGTDSNFTYAITGTGEQYAITATSNNTKKPGTIVLERNTTGTVTRGGTGVFGGIR